MPTLRLNPGPLSVEGNDPVIVGSGSQWADESDATYAVMVNEDGGGFRQIDAARGFLDLLPEFASIVSIAWHVRASGTTTDGELPRMFPYIAFGSTFFEIEPVRGQLLELTGGGTATDYDGTISTQNFVDYGVTPNGVGTWLNTGARLVAAPGTSASAPLPETYTLTVYEFWLTVTYTVAEVAPTFTRIFPRHDSLGVGRARIFPRGRSQQAGRIVGGYR